MALEVLPLTTIGIIILIAIIFSTIIKKLGQNEVIGFILAGFLLGPFFLNFLHPHDQLVVGFAELGLFVLLFYLGIELSLKDFLAAGSTIFGLALIDMALTTGIGMFVMLWLGYSLMFSIIVGIMLFCTSTAIVAKFILNNNLMSNKAAKTSISILILQDFLGILLLVFVTSFSSTQGSVVDLGIKAVLFAVTTFFAVYHLSRMVEDWMTANDFGHTEITLYALGIGLITATLASVLGLSTAIGAYFAGFALSETASGLKIKHDVGFLRDFFLVFFFVGFGTTLFYDSELAKIVLPSLDQFAYMAVLAIALGILAITAHSISSRVFGKVFDLKPEESSLMAVLLSPLGEFVVIIATVTGGVLVAAERTVLAPLAFLLIISTLLLFQPLYAARQKHEKFFAMLPQIPKGIQTKHVQEEVSPAVKYAQQTALNFFVVICFAAITVILFDELPKFGVPILYSRELTSLLVFIFFAALPLKKSVSALRRLIEELDKNPKHQTSNVKNPPQQVPLGKNAKRKKRRK